MLKQDLQLKQALSPRQIIEATLLQLNNSKLEKIILEELEKNPILEPAEIVEEGQNSTDSEDVNNEDWEDDYEPSNIYEPKRDKKHLPIPDQTNWYQPTQIYADAVLRDNGNAYGELVNTSMETLYSVIQSQPVQLFIDRR